MHIYAIYAYPYIRAKLYMQFIYIVLQVDQPNGIIPQECFCAQFSFVFLFCGWPLVPWHGPADRSTVYVAGGAHFIQSGPDGFGTHRLFPVFLPHKERDSKHHLHNQSELSKWGDRDAGEEPVQHRIWLNPSGVTEPWREHICTHAGKSLIFSEPPVLPCVKGMQPSSTIPKSTKPSLICGKTTLSQCADRRLLTVW